ncbi:alanine--tRNA ligase [Patescibacteria group bacterium]|nr:alanine--tRNA ligase [Patescibacteria group bacterium]
MNKPSEIRKKFLQFFETKGHIIIPSAPLIPENDPTVLFTTAGMHPLVPFLLGQPHPAGKRLANVQKCIRTVDIEEVGDTIHNTFFEMLGNWSFGDYFKEKSINWSWEFLTTKKWLGLDPNRIAVSCFAGDEDAPKDEDAADIWRRIGIKDDKIAFLSKDDNWWGPAGQTGPCGPDTEIFYWIDEDNPAPKKFDPIDNRWVEIWNNVFMEYNKTKAGKYEPLTQKNVDTGLGFERLVMVLNQKRSIYETELFTPLNVILQKHTKKTDIKSERIILDHTRTAIFLLSEKLTPSNLEHGYVLRKVIRRAIRRMRNLEIKDYQDLFKKLTHELINGKNFDYPYIDYYPELKTNENFIVDELVKETVRFEKVLEKGIKEFNKSAEQIKQKIKDPNKQVLSGRLAFKLYDTYGFPIEITKELADEKNIKVDIKGYQKAYQQHQELSKQATEGKFKGGLADHSEITTIYHSLTHILHSVLRKTLGSHVEQKGSNITAERLRFDFSHPGKLTLAQIDEIQTQVNRIISRDLEIIKEKMALDQALAKGALGLFADKYGDKVTVYTIQNKQTGEIYSTEICGGPHIKDSQNIGSFKIIKEESSSAGIRRIKATVILNPKRSTSVRDWGSRN